jgi:hypothetical protein
VSESHRKAVVAFALVGFNIVRAVRRVNTWRLHGSFKGKPLRPTGINNIEQRTPQSQTIRSNEQFGVFAAQHGHPV